MVQTGYAHGASKRPGAGTGIIQFGRIQDVDIDSQSSSDEDLAVGEQGGVVLTACVHGAGTRPGATLGMGDRSRPGKHLLRQPGSQCCSGNDSQHAPQRLSPGKLVVGSHVGEVFQPVRHHHLLFFLKANI